MAARKRNTSKAAGTTSAADEAPQTSTDEAVGQVVDDDPAGDTQTTDYTHAGGHRLTEYGWIVDRKD